MTTTTGPKLPVNQLGAGYSVAVEEPYAAGSLAHRPQTMTRPKPGRLYAGTDIKETVAVPACVDPGPDAEVCAWLSAAWANHIGAIACTEPSCFPNA